MRNGGLQYATGAIMAMRQSNSSNCTRHSMRRQDVSIWIHTSVPSPYRRHLFEKIAKRFPNTKVFFSLDMMRHAWYRYRAWDDDSESWRVQCINLRQRIPLPLPHAYVAPRFNPAPFNTAAKYRAFGWLCSCELAFDHNVLCVFQGKICRLE